MALLVIIAILGSLVWLAWPTGRGDTASSKATEAIDNGRARSAKTKTTEPKIMAPPESDLARPGFYPPRYRIRAEYTEDPRSISGTERLLYVNAEDRPMEDLRFQVWTNEDTFTERGGGTQVRNATVNGKDARLDAAGTELVLTFPEPLPEGATAEVEFEFETAIPEIEAPFGHHRGVSSLGVWYPMLAVYDEEGWHVSPPTDFGEPYFAEASDYEVNLTVPKNLSPVATGVETKSEKRDDSRTFTYEVEAVRDFALAIGEDFSVESRRVGETTIKINYRPDSAFRAERAADLAAASLKYFSEIYGPYPYDELELVDTPLLSGTEYSTLTFVSMANSKDYIFDTVIPHEVAHQWWYVKVGNDQFTSPWLDESLATYSEWIFTGDAATRFPDIVQPYAPLDSPVSDFPDTSSYQNTTYLYGAQLYRDLAYEIGPDTLLEGLRDYATEYAHETTDAEDLVNTLSETAGKDLSPFFRDRGVTLESASRQKKNP